MRSEYEPRLRTKESNRGQGKKTNCAYLPRLCTKNEGGQAGSRRRVLTQFNIKSRIHRACAQN